MAAGEMKSEPTKPTCRHCGAQRGSFPIAVTGWAIHVHPKDDPEGLGVFTCPECDYMDAAEREHMLKLLRDDHRQTGHALQIDTAPKFEIRADKTTGPYMGTTSIMKVTCSVCQRDRYLAQPRLR